MSAVSSGHGPSSPGQRVHESVNPSYGDVVPLFYRALVSCLTHLSNWSHNAQSGTNRGYMAANRVVERCCLPERLGKS